MTKVLTVYWKYDYGQIKRGESTVNRFFTPALKEIFDDVVSFWPEENSVYEDNDACQTALLELVEKENPDIVFFDLMKDEIKPETVAKITQKYKTINFFDDDQWRFDIYSKFIAKNFTYCTTVDKHSIKKYKEINYNNIFLTQWGTYKYIDENTVKNIKYKYDVTFVGQKTDTREWIIYELEKRGIKVECFGYGWPNGRIPFEKMEEVFLTSKINLNLSNSLSYDVRFKEYYEKTSRLEFKKEGNIKDILKIAKRFLLPRKFNKLQKKYKKNVEQIKARNFEICGLGGFQLTQYINDLSDYYIVGKDVGVFSNIDELELLIKYYLDNEELREKIKMNGYYRTKDYTYEMLFRKIFKEIGIM